MDWLRDKVVLITGGSDGFGAEMAQVCARAGAQVGITARDPDRLEQAVRMLRDSGGVAEGFPCDVTNDEQVAALFRQVQNRFQRLDMLVNNVGRSTRGLASETTPEQFRELLETNFLSAVRCTRAALPRLRTSRGHLVFMGSLAAKVAAKYLGAYPASKFALAAYAQQLRLELSSDGVHVLLVCPGPITRHDAGRRYDQQVDQLPEAARKPGGGVALKGIPPQLLARRILRSCQRRDPELVVPGKVRWLAAISQIWPSLSDWIIQRQTGR